MICQKCGKEISDASKFCAFCGAPANQAKPVEQAVPFDDEATIVLDNQAPKKAQEELVAASDVNASAPEPEEEQIPIVPVQEIAPEPIPVMQAQNEAVSAGPAPQAQNMDSFASGAEADKAGYEPKKKHTAAVLAVFGVIALAVIVLIVVLAKTLFGGDKLDSRLFYLEDNELSAITNIKASDPQDVKIEDIRNGEYVSAYSLVQLSKDGSYLYYFSDVDSDGETGTLCRIPTAKVKLKESANDKLVEEIDSKVDLNKYTVLDDNTVVYVRKSDELTWFDGKESYELGECSSYYYQLTDDEKYVVYLDDDTLIATEISKKGTETEIDDDVSSLLAVGDKDFILYSQVNGEDAYSYCVAGIGKDPEVVADDVYDYYGLNSENKSFYYTIADKTENSLYDYVNDPYASDDANIKEPRARDYMSKVKASQAISEDDQEYYSSMDDFKENSLFYYGYYEDAYEAWSYYNYDDDNYYYYDDNEDQWYTAPDYDAYDAAWSDYNEVKSRIDLRENLKEETITEYYYHLYFYENGTSTEVCANINGIETFDRQALVYRKVNVGEAPEAKYNIDEIYSAYDLWEELDESEDTDGAYYFCNKGTGESEITGLDSVSNMSISKDGKTVLLAGDYDSSDDTYIVLAYAVSSTGLGKETEVSDQCYSSYVRSYGNEFYYFEDVEDGMGTLYLYDGSKSYLLAEDIVSSDIFYGDDGSIIGYSDINSDSYELSVYDKNGKDERVARDVTSYTYLGNNCYIVMKDGDLYYIDKKGNDTRLARNVSYYVYPGQDAGHWIN